MTSTVHHDHLLTLDEWDALPDEDVYRKAELVEGVLQMAPSAVSRHKTGSSTSRASTDPSPSTRSDASTDGTNRPSLPPPAP